MIRSEHILSIFGEKINMHLLYLSVGDMRLELMVPPPHRYPPPPPPPPPPPTG